ncbi:hypothetical protein HY493_05740 [Candidatus Woesearchaeota archaeon]|nr:hypothetical protein [Candidatus Woesearchaeota archaeon]
MVEETAVSAQHDVALTYETLYELMRREKGREELQQLDPKFFAQLVGYLRDKETTYGDAGHKNDLFSISERDRLHLEMQNIRRLVKELYERREKKIIDMALNRSRTNANIVDTTNLLTEERAFFDQVVSVLDLFRNNVLGSLLQVREPQLASHTLSSFTPPTASAFPSVPASQQDFPSTADPGTIGGQSTLSTSPSEPAIKHVRFLQEVPQVVGAEMEPYGPFSPNDTAELPSEIADIWIEQGACVER